MPALPAVSNVLRFTLKHTLSEDTDVINGFFMQFTSGTPTPTNLNELAADTLGFWSTRIAPLATPGLVLKECTIIDLTSATGAVGSFPGIIPGSNGGNGQGAGVAAVIKFKVARRYRGGHPRVYQAGVPVDYLTDSQRLSDTAIGNYRTGWTNFISDIAGEMNADFGASSQVNVSYFHGFTNVTFPSGRTRPVPSRRATPLVDPVSSIDVNPKLGSQRRRNTQGS
jgi:hypothetical protein